MSSKISSKIGQEEIQEMEKLKGVEITNEKERVKQLNDEIEVFFVIYFYSYSSLLSSLTII